MSLIICKPDDGKITKQRLEECFTEYSDGIGMSFVDDNKKLICKNKFTVFENFYKSYCEIEKGRSVLLFFAEKSYILGDKYYKGPLYLDSNHTYAQCGRVWTNHTDESHLFRLFKLLKNIWHPKFFGTEYFSYLIDGVCNSANLVIMNNKGQMHIGNTNSGVLFDKVWYSESPYQFSSYKYSRTNTMMGSSIKENTKRSGYSPPGYLQQRARPDICNSCKCDCKGTSFSVDGLLYCPTCYGYNFPERVRGIKTKTDTDINAKYFYDHPDVDNVKVLIELIDPFDFV